MKINIDLEILKDLKLTPNLYIFLYCCYHSVDYKEFFSEDIQESTSYLEQLGFIKDGEQVILRKKALDIFETKNSKEEAWLEFKEAYPKKEGPRALHNKQDACKEKYFRLLHNYKHTDILRGLENQKLAKQQAVRERAFFPPWQAMEPWIGQKTFLMYQDYKQEVKVEKVKGI